MLDLSGNFRIAGNTARIVTCDVLCSQGLAFGWREKCGLEPALS